VALLNRQLIFPGLRLLDSLMTIGAASYLAGRKFRWSSTWLPGGDRLKLKAVWKRLAVRLVRKVDAEVASEKRMKPVGLLFEVVQAECGSRGWSALVTHGAKSRAPCKIFLGEVVTTDAGWMGGERDDFHLLRRHPMANIATDFCMLSSFMIESCALAAGLRPAGLGPIGLRSLEVQRSNSFRGRRESKVASHRQKAAQSEYALLDPPHRQRSSESRASH